MAGYMYELQDSVQESSKGDEGMRGKFVGNLEFGSTFKLVRKLSDSIHFQFIERRIHTSHMGG